MAMARTMMLHAAIYWPNSADATLWPMAVSHAVFLYNHMPIETTGISPNDLFMKTRWAQSKLHDIHVWGCPVYVLDSTIADGKKIPKWKPRSECAIYMGLSPKHTSQVPLVLNQRTPDGEVKKHKARHCCRGDLEETYDETYAPVVAWSTVRFFLVLSISFGWHTCSVDFSNAFVQATLDKKVWIHLPRGFTSTQGRNTCLRLKKSLYGLSVAPRLWYHHLMVETKRLGSLSPFQVWNDDSPLRWRCWNRCEDVEKLALRPTFPWIRIDPGRILFQISWNQV
jgi:hypothetical protein